MKKQPDSRMSDASREREEDPWEKLSDAERKKAERHLRILYGVMILLIVLPFVMFFLFRKPA